MVSSGTQISGYPPLGLLTIEAWVDAQRWVEQLRHRSQSKPAVILRNPPAFSSRQQGNDRSAHQTTAFSETLGELAREPEDPPSLVSWLLFLKKQWS